MEGYAARGNNGLAPVVDRAPGRKEDPIRQADGLIEVSRGERLNKPAESP